MSGCVPDSRQSGSIRCISSSFLFNNGTFYLFNMVTTRIQWGPGIYRLGHFLPYMLFPATIKLIIYGCCTQPFIMLT